MQNNIYDDSVIFINRSYFSEDEFVDAVVTINKRFIRIMLYAAIAVLFAVALITATSLYVGITKEDIIDIAIFSMVAIAFMAIYFIQPMLIRKNQKLRHQMNYEYLFYDDKVTVNLASQDITAKETKNYNDFKLAYVTNDRIFIYITKAQAYIMKKDANADRILEFLASKNIRIKNKTKA